MSGLFQKKKSKLEMAQAEVQDKIVATNRAIEELGKNAKLIYDTLNAVQDCFDAIRNEPDENRGRYKALREIRSKWIHEALKLERGYKSVETKTAVGGAAGAGMGVAVTAMGPTVAMGIATTIGHASTGVLISTLHGAAATNAALAWLGGGALAAGGGGMFAGQFFLTLMGPVGWTIAGVAGAGSILALLVANGERHALERILLDICSRETKTYKLATVEIWERIRRITDEDRKLKAEIERIRSFGTDFKEMTEAQQDELGVCYLLMCSATQLLVNPILSLQPKYTLADFEQYDAHVYNKYSTRVSWRKEAMVSLACYLYDIHLEDYDRYVLAKALAKNKGMLEAMNLDKADVTKEKLEIVSSALAYKAFHEREQKEQICRLHRVLSQILISIDKSFSLL